MYNGANGIQSYTFNLPVLLSYGLSDQLTANANAYFYKTSSKFSSTMQNGAYSDQSKGWDVNAGLSLNYLFIDDFGNNNRLSVGANWFGNSFNQDDLSSYTNGYQQETINQDKQSFTILSASWDMLVLNTSISIHDLRRSYYTGNFLHKEEVANQLQVKYSTRTDYSNSVLPSTMSNEKAAFTDSLAVGALDLLQLSIKGVLFQDNFISIGWHRYAIAQVTFHNLRFNGTELSDFDYFFGKIDNPGDYSLTLSGLLSSDNTALGSMIEPNSELLLNARLGVIDGFDAGVNYGFTKYNGSNSSSSNSWGIALRANLLRAFRVQCTFGWGNSQFVLSDQTTKDNSLNIQATLEALF